MAGTFPIVLADSITDLPQSEESPVVVSGSHGGITAAAFSLRVPIQGVLFNDAGVGKDRAGIEGIHLLEQCGVYAATVDAFTARIGSSEETLNGCISFANGIARAIGIRSGMSGKEAAGLMAVAPQIRLDVSIEFMEIMPMSSVIHESGSGHRIIAVDSNSLIGPGNTKDIVLTGSHGGLVGSKPAVPYSVLAVFYNDAGVGKNGAGISRLPWLEGRGIAAATVTAVSARIGSGLETYHCGIISHVNAQSFDLGIKPSMPAREAAWLILRKGSKRLAQ